jgi:hypothetical protein
MNWKNNKLNYIDLFYELRDQDSYLDDSINNLFNKKYSHYNILYETNREYLNAIFNLKDVKNDILKIISDILKIISDIIEVLDKRYPELINTCSRILTPVQNGPICWFMATFVAMFYSQRSRKILLKASKYWDTTRKVFSLLKNVLNDHYLSSNGDKYEYFKLKDDTFVEILSELHKENKNMFMFNPEFMYTDNDDGIGYCSYCLEFYIGRLYDLLNIDYTIFEYNSKGDDDILVRSLLNKEFNNEFENIIYSNGVHKFNMKRLFINPEIKFKPHPSILIVIVDKYDKYTKKPRAFNDNLCYKGNKFPDTTKFNNIITDPSIKDGIKSMKDIIKHNGVDYNLDSVILSDWGDEDIGHAIAGITCEENKYVYNGWAMMEKTEKTETRRIPCELMKYDWNVTEGSDFCLSKNICIPIKVIPNNLCFNFSKGLRTLVYVRKESMYVNMLARISKVDYINIYKKYTRSIHHPTTQIHKSYRV